MPDIEYQDSIIADLESRGELGELLGEGNDRIVFAHAKNPENSVIKVPKSDLGVEQNNFEFRQYITEDVIARQMGKEYFPNGLARCCIAADKKCLYMQRLTVTEGSDFGVIPHNGVIRRFDMNFRAY